MALFDDFFSSSKGPGAIATCLALFVLASFTGLGFLVFDGRFNGDQANGLLDKVKSQEFRIAGLQNMAAELEEEIAQAKERTRVQDDLNRVQRTLADEKQGLAELETEVADAQEKLSGTRQSWEDYKNDYRAAERAKAIGLKIDELTTLDGKVFKNVTVREINNMSMRIMHESGPATVNWDQLPLDMQERFQFDKRIAAEAADLADADKVKRAKWMGAVNTAKRIATLKNNILLQEHGISNQQRTIMNNKRTIASNIQAIANYRQRADEARNLHAQAMAAGRRSSHLTTVTRMENSAKSRERANLQLAENNRLANERISEIEQEIEDTKQQIEDLESNAKKK